MPVASFLLWTGSKINHHEAFLSLASVVGICHWTFKLCGRRQEESTETSERDVDALRKQVREALGEACDF